jgi:hypothetical protein
MARWRNYFSQLLNVHWVKDGEQVEIHTAEPLVPEPSAFEVELAIEKLKSHKSPGVDQIPAELIEAGGGTICGAIHKLTISIWNKEELSEEWRESIIVPIYFLSMCSTLLLLTRSKIMNYCTTLRRSSDELLQTVDRPEWMGTECIKKRK